MSGTFTYSVALRGATYGETGSCCSHVCCYFCERKEKYSVHELHTNLHPIHLRCPPLHPLCRCGDGWAFAMHLCHPVMQSTGSPGKTAHMVGGFDNMCHTHTQTLQESLSTFFLNWNMMQTSPHLLLHTLLYYKVLLVEDRRGSAG